MPRKHQRSWSVANAKARLSELIECAQSQGPQTITRHGRDAVVVVSHDEWKRQTQQKGSLADFFANSPLRGSGLRIDRVRDDPRDLDL